MSKKQEIDDELQDFLFVRCPAIADDTVNKDMLQDVIDYVYDWAYDRGYNDGFHYCWDQHVST